ncbi:MAG: sigma-70 family RNA polymerase sigma factor [Verrucomicrobiia bacterium]
MTDSQQLLADYVQTGSETAFRKLVTRYLDFVYSVALRIVEGDTHRAQDVAQMVFVDLARLARTLSHNVMLGGWLHRHTCFVAANNLRSERRRQSREGQAVEMNALQDDSAANWRQVAPILDDAIIQLESEDRAAILLRFFEQRDFRSVGEVLGSTEDAARMRVTRALEKLHALLIRRGVTTSAAALGVALSVNAVQAAPAGLAAAISTAAVLAGTTVAATATATITKAIAMTTLQKSLVTATIAVAVGAGAYEAHQASALRTQVDTLQQQQASLTGQIQQLATERNDAIQQLAALRDENERLNRNATAPRDDGSRGQATGGVAQEDSPNPLDPQAQMPAAPDPANANKATSGFALPTDPLIRRTLRETHKWIENLNTSNAVEFADNGTLAFSWEELTASYPQQARILDDRVEDLRLWDIVRLKQRFEPIPARLAVHYTYDVVTIRKYGGETYRVFLGDTNGVTHLEFRVPTTWPAESQQEQEETDRRASLELEKDAARAAAPPSPEPNPELQERVTKIIVPEVSWTNVAPTDCLSWLERESGRLNPDGGGVNFVLADIAEHSGKPITLNLRNVPLIDIIKEVSSQSGWAYQLDSDGVTFYEAGAKPPVPHFETPPPGVMQDKLTRIVLPEVVAREIKIGDLLRYISEESRRVDPKGEGVNCVVSSDSGKSITLNLHNIPLEDVIKYVSQLAGLTYRFESNAIVFDKSDP